MADTVYILGAGINMVVRHATRRVRPPLARDLFRQLHADLGEEELAQLIQSNFQLYEYIEHYWKLDGPKLSEADLDLEECFTLVEQHERDAKRKKDDSDIYRLWQIKGQLTALLAGLLDEISLNQPPEEEGLRGLARRVFAEEAAIVTFNYDTLLERAMVGESGGQPWDPILAYSTPFDEFEKLGGDFAEFRSFRFPAQNHTAPFLKVHGSLNWFRYAGGNEIIRQRGGIPTQGTKKLEQTLSRRIDTPNESPEAGNTYLLPDGSLLEQLIITPVLDKEVDQRPFPHIWQRAKDEMRGCKRLIVGGYSFPPTDFATRRLFLESFSGSTPDELIVINPDTSVVQQAKNLCHFEGPVSVCSSLREYLAR